MKTKEAIRELKEECWKHCEKYSDTHCDECYISAAIDALKTKLMEERVSLICGVDDKGQLDVYTVPMGQEDSFYGKMLHHVSDVFRRFGLKYTDQVSQYFYGPEEKGCKNCYHRAEYIVHGFLCGLAIYSIVLVAIGLMGQL